MLFPASVSSLDWRVESRKRGVALLKLLLLYLSGATVKEKGFNAQTAEALNSLVYGRHVLQDGDTCGGAVLEPCSKHMQELCRTGQERILQRHQVSPDH